MLRGFNAHTRAQECQRNIFLHILYAEDVSFSIEFEFKSTGNGAVKNLIIHILRAMGMQFCLMRVQYTHWKSSLEV